MSINVLRIDPDGTITAYEAADPLQLAYAEFDHAEVVTCRNRFTSQISIGVVHATGQLDGLPLNEKAWALSGRSPIFGPMYYSLDLPCPPLPDALVATLLSDKDWIGDETRAAMQQTLSASE